MPKKSPKGTPQHCSFCGHRPCTCPPIPTASCAPNSTPGSISGQTVPEITTSLHALKLYGVIANGVTYNGQTAYTPISAKKIPSQVPQTAGTVYAPYLPLYQTANEIITLPVVIQTAEIFDYAQRFPKGLLLHESTYNRILIFFNYSFPHKLTIPLRKLPEPLVCILYYWEVDPLYRLLWDIQGHGPLLLDEQDKLRFRMKIKVLDETGQSRNMSPLIESLKKEYLDAGDDSSLQIRLRGKFVVKQGEIINLKPEALQWYEDGKQIV